MTILESPTWTLADRLKKARLNAGLDQSDLAERLGSARNSISNYETGRSEPSASTFIRWAHITGVSLEWLADGVEIEEAAYLARGTRVFVHPPGLEPGTHWLRVSGVDDLLAIWAAEDVLAGVL